MLHEHAKLQIRWLLETRLTTSACSPKSLAMWTTGKELRGLLWPGQAGGGAYHFALTIHVSTTAYQVAGCHGRFSAPQWRLLIHLPDATRSYQSPLIHHVVLEDLQPSTQYFYMVGSSGKFSSLRNFTTLATASMCVRAKLSQQLCISPGL